MSQWSWILTRIVRQVWFRAALISLASVVIAVLAAVVTPLLPWQFNTDIGQSSVGTILDIMASSMLAVTTFSLTAMVSAYSSATQLGTPRATQLMISDSTSQNALSTFLGAFVFAIVGIIGLQTDAYGQDGRIILFGATVAIVALVVVTLLRWIGHIASFGRLSDVIDRVETAACKTMRTYADQPHLGGRPAVAVPADAEAIVGGSIGYVTHVDVAALGKIAEDAGIRVHVAALPGAMVHPARPLMSVEGVVDDDRRERLLRAFTIERHRSFDQDPRLGVIALSEIASRALAPATNDPGTAIEVLNALLRVLSLLPPDLPDTDEVAERPHVHVPRHAIGDLLVDAFRPILREGARETEVTLRLTNTLAALRAALPHGGPTIDDLARQTLAMARDGMQNPGDLAEYEDVHKRLWGDQTNSPVAS